MNIHSLMTQYSHKTVDYLMNFNITILITKRVNMRTNIYYKKHSHIFALLLSVTQIFPSKLIAADFTITDGQVVTIQQALTGNETGTINNGGQLNVNLDAITVSGADNFVNNAGSISTSAGNADGIFSDNTASNTNITNSGSIVTTGPNNANGILTEGSNDIIVSTGTITTNGTNSRGIRSTGGNVRINHSGTINTQNSLSYGIVSTADSANINNSGSITTTGFDSDGIRSSGTNAVIISSGNINTTNTNSRGIRSSAANITIIHSGNIMTQGLNSYGIVSNATSTVAIISNTGNITTAGNNAHGLYSRGDDATITNCGSISVSGTNAIGISLEGTNGTITNCGSIIVTGNATQAIEGSANDDVLNIATGSHIIGSIDLGAGNDVVNITGYTPYQTLTFTNVETINALSTYAIINSNTVTTVEPTRFAAEVNVAENFNSAIQHVLYENMFSPALDNNSSENTYSWARAFSKDTKHGRTDNRLAYTYQVQGLIAGYETRTRLVKKGIILGYAKSDTAISTEPFYKDTTRHDSIFTGAYGKYKIGEDWDMGLTLNIGIQEHSASRTIKDNLNGSETADADFSSKYIAPSISFLEHFEYGPNWQLRSIVKAEAVWAELDHYTETGTTSSNLRVADRSLSVLKLRGDIEATYRFNASKSEASISLGYDYRDYRSDQVDISLGNGKLQFNELGDNAANSTYIGTHISHKLENGIELYGDIDLGTGDEESSLFLLGTIIRL